MDAQSRLPKVNEPLEFQDGQAFLVKTDILRETMYFSYDKNSLSEMYPLPACKVKEIIEMNKGGKRPESLKPDAEPSAAPEFVSAVGDDAITRFDKQPRKKKRRGKPRRMPGDVKADSVNGQAAEMQGAPMVRRTVPAGKRPAPADKPAPSNGPSVNNNGN